LDREVFGQQQRHLRRVLQQLPHQSRQQVRSDRVNHAKPQRARQRVLALARDLLDAGSFVKHLLRLTNDALSSRRCRHLAGAALEDLCAEFLLEFLDRDRQGGLADEAGLGRAAKMALARHCNDVLELGERHS